MHPALKSILRWFDFGHLPDGPIRDTSTLCHELAYKMADSLPSNPELVAGLRKLLEAKDAFVRSAVLDVEGVKEA